MAALAALGFKLHTGWAVLIAAAGTPGKFEVLLRRRVELLPPGDVVPRFVFHKAAELPLLQAAELIERAETASRKAARNALKQALDDLRSRDIVAKAAGIPGGADAGPKDLAAVLRSHPAIHTAEAALFRRAVVSACEDSGLRVIFSRERYVWLCAANTWELKEAALGKQVDGLRKSVGSPWGADQKTAMVLALMALR
jgi:hypothetical protein